MSSRLSNPKNGTQAGSVIAPVYAGGDYFADPQRHSADARFKADSFLKLFFRFIKQHSLRINSIVDVGCGSGSIAKLIEDALHLNGFDMVTVKAYDVSPHVLNIKNEGVEYIYGDFCASEESVDVVTLFDVFEHVPDTIEFIKRVSQHCKIICFHIPLDDSLNFALRDMFHPALQNPGHIVFMDIVGALNLLALAGLRVVDYEYIFDFLAPSGRSTLLSKIILPLRYLLAKINPWLLSKTLGGMSLLVIACTPDGLREVQR